MVVHTLGFEGKSSTFTGEGGGDAFALPQPTLQVRCRVLSPLPRWSSYATLVGDSKDGGVGNGLGDAGRKDG